MRAEETSWEDWSEELEKKNVSGQADRRGLISLTRSVVEAALSAGGKIELMLRTAHHRCPPQAPSSLLPSPTNEGTQEAKGKPKQETPWRNQEGDHDGISIGKGDSAPVCVCGDRVLPSEARKLLGKNTSDCKGRRGGCCKGKRGKRRKE